MHTGPIRILSGLRCIDRNKAVSGAKDSQHLTGGAADIIVDDLPMSELYTFAAGVTEFHNGGIGIYPDGGFIHVDVRLGRARWGHLDGKYVPFTEAWAELKEREGA